MWKKEAILALTGWKNLPGSIEDADDNRVTNFVVGVMGTQYTPLLKENPLRHIAKSIYNVRNILGLMLQKCLREERVSKSDLEALEMKIQEFNTPKFSQCDKSVLRVEKEVMISKIQEMIAIENGRD